MNRVAGSSGFPAVLALFTLKPSSWSFSPKAALHVARPEIETIKLQARIDDESFVGAGVERILSMVAGIGR